ncbi:hypothetical protein F4553_004079 [Allocatelliglobosispora scoriae]|uniref:Serine protease n=1 Tax=Allocatelliglobosispora scoriae TaxID=643052 RepID=A0A841BVA9_9ACTN|nr:serine protease [Allocatelliglobosispora scoriae]MBB5870700.1 hypothetical protein [Allocatelliglobosispora scoriae]
MRRTFALLVGVGLSLSLGAAGIAAMGGGADAPPQVTGLRSAEQQPVEKAKANEKAAVRVPVKKAERPGVVWDRGAEEAGRVETTSTTLGYLDAQRQATFRYPGAEYVKLHFTRVLMLPGDYLTVSTPDGTESHRYDGNDAEGTWSMSVTGDTARMELHAGPLDLLGLGATIASLGVTVDKVARGFTREERAAKSEADRARKSQGREESVCGSDTKADAVCFRTTDPVLYTRSKAVVRLLIDGTELCTAWRVGVNNRLLTNHHCLETSAQAAQTEVWFNYQCAQCGGYDVFRPTKVWASEVLATDATLDFTLFSVENFPLVQHYGYLSLDVRAPQVGELLYVPQHPSGAPAAITVDEGNGNCQIIDASYDGYAKDTDASYYCDTEGGSSGSPVLSRVTNRVIALHHFGGCPNSGVRIDRIYPKISTLL